MILNVRGYQVAFKLGDPKMSTIGVAACIRIVSSSQHVHIYTHNRGSHTQICINTYVCIYIYILYSMYVFYCMCICMYMNDSRIPEPCFSMGSRIAKIWGTPWRPRRCERGWVASSRRRFGGRWAGQRLANGREVMGDLWYFFHIFFALSAGKCNIQLKMRWKRDELYVCISPFARDPGLAMQWRWCALWRFLLFSTSNQGLSFPVISDSYIFHILFTAQIPSGFLTYLWKLAHNCGWSIPITYIYIIWWWFSR